MMKTTRTSRPTSLIAAACLLASLFGIASATPAGACGSRKASVFRAMKAGTLETVTVRTLNLDVEQPKAMYRIGETAKIKVTVTRPAKEDPLGEGTPMERPYVEPAPGVMVGVGLYIGNVFLPGAAVTDDQGVALVRIKIEDWAPANKWADASAYAWKVVQDSPCATIQEDGYLQLPRLFKVAAR